MVSKVLKLTADAAARTIEKLRRKLIKQSIERAKTEDLIILNGDIASGESDGYTYVHIKSVRLVDGDTLEFDIDTGFKNRSLQKVRVARVDLPESDTAAGPLCKEMYRVLFSTLYIVSLTTVREDKYGRWLTHIVFDKIGDLSDLLLRKRIAKPYSGKAKPKWSDADIAESIDGMNQLIVYVNSLKSSKSE